jgi:predicted nucleic acid-binding protein
MSTKQLLDTNYVIKLLSEVSPIPKEKYSISIISYIEFLSGKMFDEGDIAELSTELESKFEILELTREISLSAAALRRQISALKLGDAIILATSLVNDLELLTLDKQLQQANTKLTV